MVIVLKLLGVISFIGFMNCCLMFDKYVGDICVWDFIVKSLNVMNYV